MITLLLCTTLLSAHGAELSGTIYTSDLNVAEYSLLLIDTTPAQRIILEDGYYNISLPPGAYHLTAYYSEGGRTYEDKTTFNISEEGAYTYDFILFPSDMNSSEALPSIGELTIPESKQSSTLDTLGIMVVAACILIAVLVIVAVWKRKKDARQRKEQEMSKKIEKRVIRDIELKQEAPEKEQKEELQADLKSIIAILKQEDGRTTQKELRRHIPCSEAKMSMMLTELEHKGKIERIKKGRANLIVLKR
jgi:uncharacterized membrane protein